MTEEDVDEYIEPNYNLCGGGDLNCEFWDDINGCWKGCNYFGDQYCTPPDMGEEDEEDDE